MICRPALLASLLSVLTILGCADADLGTRAVEVFHERMNTGEHSAIYMTASDEFRRSTTESDWLALTDAVRRKMGKIVEAKQTSIHVTTGTFGTVVNQTYATTFSDGRATERFTWTIRNGTALLAGYRIESQQLITR